MTGKSDKQRQVTIMEKTRDFLADYMQNYLLENTETRAIPSSIAYPVKRKITMNFFELPSIGGEDGLHFTSNNVGGGTRITHNNAKKDIKLVFGELKKYCIKKLMIW